MQTIRTKAHRALVSVLTASRRDAGLTQRELADKCKRPHAFISSIESGDRRVDVVEFGLIAKAIGIDPRKLYERFLSWDR